MAQSKMTKAKWKNKIKKHCEEVGTYRAPFDPVIETLAATLEERDRVYEKYVEEGSKATIDYINKFGATNTVKNPLLILWDDLNKSALAYWRDLGLTPAGLKKIDEQALKVKKKNPLAEALKELGKDI